MAEPSWREGRPKTDPMRMLWSQRGWPRCSRSRSAALGDCRGPVVCKPKRHVACQKLILIRTVERKKNPGERFSRILGRR